MRWIISDIDGCLTPEESVPWEWERFSAFVQRVRAANEGRSSLAPMTLCTGRPQPYVEAMMKMLGVTAPAICENGSVLYTLHDNYARYAPGIDFEKIHALRQLREYIEAELLAQYPGAVIQFGKEAQLSVFSQRPEQFGPMRRQVEAYLADHHLAALSIAPSHFYLNITPEGTDKGSAVAAIRETLGVEREALIGIGDTEGDLPLARAVGWFACPANATDAIKAAADYVSPYPMLEGILDILDQPACQREDAHMEKMPLP